MTDRRQPRNQHRVDFFQPSGNFANLFRRLADASGEGGDILFRLRQELVQRRIKQAHIHRQAIHDLNRFEDIRVLEIEQLVEVCLPFPGPRRESWPA